MATQIVFDTELVASAAEPCSRIFAPAPLGPLVLGLDGSDTGRGAAAMAEPRGGPAVVGIGG